MADYVQPVTVTRRVRFFDGQFLVDQDFIDEQKYHLDRERRLGKVLRITGIVDGLQVTTPGVNQVKVTAGTAIDRDGRLLVLAQDRTLDLPAAVFNNKTGIKLIVLYREDATELATTGSVSQRRWLEDPQIIAVTTDNQRTEKPWNDTMPPLVLATLRLDNKGVVTIDATAAERAGVRLPGSVGIGLTDPGEYKLNVNGRTRLGGAEYGATAVLSVSPGTIYFDSPGVVGGRFVLDGSTGNVGINQTSPGDYKLSVGGPTRLGGITDYESKTVLSVAPGTVQFDAPNVAGGRFVVNGANGRVGIGAPSPRTGLDTGASILSGAVNDFVKAQFTLMGGGKVTWDGPPGRLAWDQRFVAIAPERGSTFKSGYVDIKQPTAAIPAANVYDGKARTADTKGVLLNEWESLYAVHPVGGEYDKLDGFRIRHRDSDFYAPSNWILVAVVNGDDKAVRLGTGVTLPAKTSATNAYPELPTGTIVMWSGASDKIPTGWALCNGSGGTPDLRGRFIMGAGAGTTDQAPGTSGDPDQHSHNVTVKGTTTNSAGAHSHAFPYDWDKIDGYNTDIALGNKRAALDPFGAPPRSSSTSSTGSHTHPVPDLGTFTSTTYSGTNRPKWYALCFIMKL